jgi:hypothetical protein
MERQVVRWVRSRESLRLQSWSDLSRSHVDDGRERPEPGVSDTMMVICNAVTHFPPTIIQPSSCQHPQGRTLPCVHIAHDSHAHFHDLFHASRGQSHQPASIRSLRLVHLSKLCVDSCADLLESRDCAIQLLLGNRLSDWWPMCLDVRSEEMGGGWMSAKGNQDLAMTT